MKGPSNVAHDLFENRIVWSGAMKQLYIGRLIAKALSIVAHNLLPILFITTLAYVPLLAVAVLDQAPLGFGQLSYFTWPTRLMIQSLATGMMSGGILRAAAGGKVELASCFRMSSRTVLSVLGTALVTSVLTFLAAFAAGIPALIAMCVLYVAVPVAATEERGVRAALRRSRELTRGVRWSIFGATLLMGIVSTVVQVFVLQLFAGTVPGFTIFGSLAFELSGIPFAAVTATMVTVVYHDLRAQQGDTLTENLAEVFD
jgi:hypothetical protein